jgi:23S rRNA (adenine2503-C2)-methyltransferase
MRALLDLSPDELLSWLREHGQPPMRARQIRRWVVAGRAESFERMTDLPRDLRPALAAEFVPLGTAVARHLAAADGTHKLLLRLHDGQLIECVLLQEDGRHTACISTQVGCGMGCVFCASGLNGVARNLTTGEILEQLIRLRNLLPPDQRLTHIVVMGMGEPLANLDNLLAALDVATAPEGRRQKAEGRRQKASEGGSGLPSGGCLLPSGPGLGIGARHITISTVGLPAKMRRLAESGKQYHLAVSLHAPNDGLRTRIVPTNDKTGLDAILAAADDFFAHTGRQVTYEYVLLRDLNDGPHQADELARLLRGRRAHVNLIPFNDVAGLPYRRPTQEALTAFVERLRRDGISVKVRKRKGSEIDAACGQLRRTALGEADRAGAQPLAVVGDRN